MDQSVIRQQSQAAFAWALCHSRDLPGKHNRLLYTARRERAHMHTHIRQHQ